MERVAKYTYSWCNGCSRRIADVLFKDGRCPGCRKDADREVARKELTFTDEEYEEMGNL